MARKRGPAVSAFGKLHREYIARVKKLGGVWCGECYAYLLPSHDCRAFTPIYLPLPLEAYTFAADREVA